MTIEYALTRGEIVQSYFRSLASSPKFLVRILVYCIVLGVIPLAFQTGFSRSLTSSDALFALAWAAAAFAVVPLWLLFRGKTGVRTLTISSDGISTKIGSLTGQIPWKKVKLIEDKGRHVLIMSASGNAFFIPARAFVQTEQKTQFVAEADTWRKTNPT